MGAGWGQVNYYGESHFALRFRPVRGIEPFMSPLVSKQINYFPKLAVPGFTEHNTIVDHNIRYRVVTWLTIRHSKNPLLPYYAAAFIETTFFARAGSIFHQPLATEGDPTAS